MQYIIIIDVVIKRKIIAISSKSFYVGLGS